MPPPKVFAAGLRTDSGTLIWPVCSVSCSRFFPRRQTAARSAVTSGRAGKLLPEARPSSPERGYPDTAFSSSSSSAPRGVLRVALADRASTQCIASRGFRPRPDPLAASGRPPRLPPRRKHCLVTGRASRAPQHLLGTKYALAVTRGTSVGI